MRIGITAPRTLRARHFPSRACVWVSVDFESTHCWVSNRLDTGRGALLPSRNKQPRFVQNLGVKFEISCIEIAIILLFIYYVRKWGSNGRYPVESKQLLKELRDDNPKWTREQVMQEWLRIVSQDEALRNEVYRLTFEDYWQRSRKRFHN